MRPKFREAPGVRWSLTDREYILVFMAGWLGDYAAFGIEIDWTLPQTLMVRLKVALWCVGFDYCWRPRA